jgi:hypothetical protein
MDEEEYRQMREGLFKRNLPFSKGRFELTSLSEKEEEKFQKWVQENKVPFNPNDTFPDYDLRGFYKALQSGDPKAKSAINPSDSQIHYPDYWKTPYHETFSNESQWANKDAPKWMGDDKVGWKLQDSKGIIYKDESIKQIQPIGH